MSEAYVGEIRTFAGNYAPQGWALCDGSLLNISENEALYSLISTTYGGDGRTTFALPDLRGRVPVHMGLNTMTGTSFPLGQKAGTETVTLTTAQLPEHTHTVNASSSGTMYIPTNAIWAASNGLQYSTNNPDGTMSATATSAVGGNQPHNNMMPFLTVSYIICLYGTYPTRS